MINGCNPDLLTVDERLDEIAAILAVGHLRMAEKRNTHNTLKNQSKPLDFGSGKSVHGDHEQSQKQGDGNHDD